MKYDFNKIINRKNTNCSKWDNANKRLKADIDLPLWVADMDFRASAEVIESITKYAAHGIYGYTYIPDDYYSSIIKWFIRRHKWSINKEDIFFCPGVIIAIKNLIQSLTEPGDNIIIQPPVYPPFFKAVTSNDRNLITNPLINLNGKYLIDYADLEKKLKLKKTKMLLLCSPHNPVGRIWTAEELCKLGNLCIEHNVFVVSDEMHCDIIHGNYVFTPFARISDEFAMNSAICIAPGKTFNLAGLQMSNIIISNPAKKKKLKDFLYNRNGLVEPNQFGIAASIAAYTYGEDWLCQVVDYIYNNYKYLECFLARHLSKVKTSELQATYLAWLDFNGYNISHDKLRQIIFDEARVGLNDGKSFGDKEGKGFFRINIACPRPILKKALARIAENVNLKIAN